MRLKGQVAMSNHYVLAIDNGTQSVRALVFDLDGNIIALAKQAIEPYFSTQPGWAEQNPDVFWQAVCQVCQSLWNEHHISPEDIKGLAITTQRATVINVDAQGEPLRPAIIWLDQRRTQNITPVAKYWRGLFKIIGMDDAITYFQREAEINWIAVHQPEIWKNTFKFLTLGGYLNYKLTNVFIDSSGNQVGYLPLDFKRKKWAHAWDWKWQALKIRRDMLPDLVQPSEKIGVVSQAAATLTGLKYGTPVIAAAGDKSCEALGTGCATPEIACLSLGSNASVNITQKKYVEAIPFVPAFPAAIPGMYNIESHVYRGFWMIEWFKQQFGHFEQQMALEKNSRIEPLLDDLLIQTTPGAEGLIVQPYWSPGIRIPGLDARGAIIGFNGGHTRAHVYRAIIEGLCYALFENMQRIEKRNRRKIINIRVAGGGSQSDVVMQIVADVFGLPASRPHTYEASALGAAIDVAVGLRLIPTFKQAITQMTRIEKTFVPNLKNHHLYQTIFSNTYLKIFPALKPLYRDLNSLFENS